MFKSYLVVFGFLGFVLNVNADCSSLLKANAIDSNQVSKFLLLPPRSDSELASLESAFIQSNGFDAKAQANFDRHTGKFRSYKNYYLSSSNVISESEAIQKAKDFIELNKQDLAIPARDLRRLEFNWDAQRQMLTVSTRESYYPQFNDIEDNNLKYSIKFIFDFKGDEFSSIEDYSNLLSIGDSKIQTKPGVMAASQKMLTELSLTDLVFEGADGKEVNLGPVSVDDIYGVKLTVDEFQLDSDDLFVGLVWKFSITKTIFDSIDYRFEITVNAITGEVLSVDPLFNT